MEIRDFSVKMLKIIKNVGWGTAFGTIKYRTTDISKFRQYLNIEISVIRFFDFRIYFFICLNYSNTKNVTLITKLLIFWILMVDSFSNCQIFEIEHFGNSIILWIFQ